VFASDVREYMEFDMSRNGGLDPWMGLSFSITARKAV